MQHKHYQEEKLLLSIVARDWDAVDMRTLQEDVDDKKAELETLLYIANILYILAFVCVCLFAPAKALHLHYIWYDGPC